MDRSSLSSWEVLTTEACSLSLFEFEFQTSDSSAGCALGASAELYCSLPPKGHSLGRT